MQLQINKKIFAEKTNYKVSAYRIIDLKVSYNNMNSEHKAV